MRATVARHEEQSLQRTDHAQRRVSRPHHPLSILRSPTPVLCVRLGSARSRLLRRRLPRGDPLCRAAARRARSTANRVPIYLFVRRQLAVAAFPAPPAPLLQGHLTRCPQRGCGGRGLRARARRRQYTMELRESEWGCRGSSSVLFTLISREGHEV